MRQIADSRFPELTGNKPADPNRPRSPPIWGKGRAVPSALKLQVGRVEHQGVIKRLNLRRPDTCKVCESELSVGAATEWDTIDRTVTCIPCAGSSVSDTPPAPNKPGESAQREYDRRRLRHDTKVEQRWGTGTIGKIAKKVVAEPQHVTAWAKGAHGERRLSNHLKRELDEPCIVLDDRKIPGTKANIDHLVIANSGLWIVDAKNYKGKVELRSTGLRNPVTTLHVAGRDRTRLVGGLTQQHAAVTTALANLGETAIPVHSVICFTNAEWPLFGGTGSIDGVWIGHVGKLITRIHNSRQIAEDLAARLLDRLARELPPA